MFNCEANVYIILDSDETYFNNYYALRCKYIYSIILSD